MSYLYKRGRFWWYGRGKFQASTMVTDKTTTERNRAKWD